MSKLYGFFGDRLYKVATKSKVKAVTVDSFKSSAMAKEDHCSRTVIQQIEIDTTSLFRQETNEAIYKQLIDYIKRSGITTINTLYFSMKVALDYAIVDDNENILDGGVRYIQTDADVVNVLMDPDPLTHVLSYRKGLLLQSSFNIAGVRKSGYGVMEKRSNNIKFVINSVKVYGSFTDQGSDFYIRDLGPASQDMTFGYGSRTISSIKEHCVEIFDSEDHNLTFNCFTLDYMPDLIMVPVKLLLNQMCAVENDMEIWATLAKNGGMESTDAPDEFDCGCGRNPFMPIVNRKPCPGNYPVPPIDPCHKPGCPVPPPKPPRPGCGIGGGHVHDPSIEIPKPILPGGDGSQKPIVPDDMSEAPEHKPDDFDENQWVIADPYDDPTLVYEVVADDIPEDEFDALTMVRFAIVNKYITDVKVGDHVKKSAVWFI